MAENISLFLAILISKCVRQMQNMAVYTGL